MPPKFYGMKYILPLFLSALCLPFFSNKKPGGIKWRVIFTYSKTINSSRRSPYIESTGSFTMKGSVSMLIDGESSFDNGHVIIQTPPDKVISFSVTGSVSEKMESKTLYPGIGIMEDRTDQYEGKPDESKQGMDFEYDPMSKQGGINAGISFNRSGSYQINMYHRPGEPDKHFSYDDHQDFGAYTASVGSSDDIIKAVKNGFTIDGGKTETQNTPSRPEETFLSTSITEYHVTILKETQFDVLIVPVDDEQYKKWLPSGPSLTGETDKGNSIGLKVVVVNKKDPSQPVTTPTTVEWHLKSSAEVGYCMNFPNEKLADRKADLRFDQSATAKEDFASITESKAISKKGKGNAMVNIISYDYGGYGSVTAQVTLEDGSIVQALSKFNNKPVFNVPMDDNSNHIADEWEKQQNIFEKNYPANWDEDYLPKDLGQHNGDGYTLFEEYRGFCENKKHIRTSALTKDLMVCDMIGDRSKDGIALFKDVTKVFVHDDFQLDEFGRETTDFETEGLNHDKCLNFNSTPETHSVDQHGIAIVKSLERKGYAMAVTKTEKLGIGTPKNYKYLEITMDFDPGPKGYNIVNGTISPSGQVVQDPVAKAKIITDNYASTVAHEMLHCCHLEHHGATDHRKVIVYLGKDAKKLTNDPNFNPDPNGFCIDDYTDNIVFTVTLFSSSTEKMIIPNPALPATGLKFYLGMQQGEHSGVEDCIMRYDAAAMYKDAAGNYFVLDAGKGYSHELTGITLCTSGNGTGVNDKDHKPRPRYGDAAPGRGNCKKQFCINDKFD